MTNTRTQEKYIQRSKGVYELLFSDDGANLIMTGVTDDGRDFCKTDAELFNRFLHNVSGTEYHYDIADGKNQEFEIMQARSKIANTNIKLGVTQASAELKFHAVQHPRAGNCRCFWSLEDLFTPATRAVSTPSPPPPLKY